MNILTASLLQIQHYCQMLLVMVTSLHVGFSCPIPTGCSNLPNITQYAQESLNSDLLQLMVNISTTKGHAFRPQGFQATLYAENMNNRRLVTNGCEGIFNVTSSSVGVDSPCPWRYQCDYNPQRIPAVLFHASCESATPQGGRGGVCNEVHHPIPYITTESCDPLGDSEWSFEVAILAVGCNLMDISITF